MLNDECWMKTSGAPAAFSVPHSAFSIQHFPIGVSVIANDPKDQKTTLDDPRQSVESGDPQHTGRVRGHVSNEQEETGRTNPDAERTQGQGKQDVSPTTPHRESGDRA